MHASCPICFHPSICGATTPYGLWPPSKGTSLLLLPKLVSSIVFLGPVCFTVDDSSVLSLLLLITVPRYLKLRTTSVSWSLVCSNIPCAKNQILFPMARSYSFNQSHPMEHWGFLDVNFFRGWAWSHTQPQTWDTKVSLFVWVITFLLSYMWDLASRYASADIALRILRPNKTHYCIKVGISSGGRSVSSLSI